MAKRVKSVQPNPSGEEKLVGGQVAQPDASGEPQPTAATKRARAQQAYDG